MLRRVLGSGVLVFALMSVQPGGSVVGPGALAPTCLAGDSCATVTLEVPALPAGFYLGSGRVEGGPDSALDAIDCTYTLGVQSGTCSKHFAWSTPENSTDPALDLTLAFIPAPENVSCVSNAPIVACTDAASWFAPPDYTRFLTIVPGENLVLQAGFALTAVAVTITRSGEGTGTVVATGSSPGAATSTTGIRSIPHAATSISCGSQCTGQFDYGRPLTLTATPDAGASFTQWTGACAGQGATCTLTPTAATSTNAVFGLAGQTTTTTTKTTTAATTTTATPTQARSTTTTTTTPAVAHQLAAQLIGIKSAKSKLGFRVEYVEVQAGETINATLLLSRDGRHLAHTSVLGIRPGDRVLALPIPGSVAKGGATLAITLTDTVGEHRTWTRAINVPK